MKYPLLASILLLILPLAVDPGAPKPTDFGESAGHRPLSAYQFGSGPVKLALIGGIHGGYEGNTVELVVEAIGYFSQHPAEIPSGISLVLVADANPDGVARGSRFNGDRVDLNRNWDFNWNPTASWAGQSVSPGPYPFSETETRALRDLLIDGGFRAVIFYHSAEGGIYSGANACHSGSGPSATLGRVISAATGYPYRASGWTSYPITGQAVDYLDCHGVAAIDVELATHSDTEWDRNLRGMQAFLKAYP